jgi:hypothetical protein
MIQLTVNRYRLLTWATRAIRRGQLGCGGGGVSVLPDGHSGTLYRAT